MPFAFCPLFQDDRVWVVVSSGGDGGVSRWCTAACPWFLLAPHPQALVVEDVLGDARFSHTIWAELGWR